LDRHGYLIQVRSSRRLEMESHRNIEVIWPLRGVKPDFKTIADFRRDNRAAFRSVFREFVLLCRRFDLYGCFAGGSTSRDASCWPWMERASSKSGGPDRPGGGQNTTCQIKS
jgi:Transposase domain (DUF772)